MILRFQTYADEAFDFAVRRALALIRHDEGRGRGELEFSVDRHQVVTVGDRFLRNGREYEVGADVMLPTGFRLVRCFETRRRSPAPAKRLAARS